MKLIKFIWVILLVFNIFGSQAKLTIFTFKDIDEIVCSNKESSLASIMTLLEEERKSSSHNFTLLNGDFLSPFCLSSIDKGAHIIDLLNSLKVDLVVLGNHEFDYGIEELKKRIAESKFKWLSSNIIDIEQKLIDGSNDFLIYDLGDITVGFIGLISQRTAKISKIGGDLYFLPVIETAKKRCKDLRNKKVDVIIALSHLTMDETIALAKGVPQINLIIGGHEGNLITFYEEDTLIYNIGENLNALSRIDLNLEKNKVGNEVKVSIYPSYRLLNFCGISPNPEMLEKIKYYQAKYKSLLSEELAILKIDLDATFDTLRTQESAFGNLIADAVKKKFDADISFITSGLFRSNHYYHKDEVIFKKDIYNELLFNNDLVLVEMLGKDLLEVLENSVSCYEQKSTKFPQVSGLAFTFDSNSKPFHRIVSVKINDKLLDLEKSYKIATVDFLLKGGDGFTAFKKAKILVGSEQNIEMVPVVVNYIKEQSALECGKNSRIIKK